LPIPKTPVTVPRWKLDHRENTNLRPFRRFLDKAVLGAEFNIAWTVGPTRMQICERHDNMQLQVCCGANIELECRQLKQGCPTSVIERAERVGFVMPKGNRLGIIRQKWRPSKCGVAHKQQNKQKQS
jgi:hypothetical protein